MKENLKDILTHLNPEVDQETLLKYLQGKLSTEEQHEVEKSLIDDPLRPMHWKAFRPWKTSSDNSHGGAAQPRPEKENLPT
jgi:hypothetical protein